MSPDRLRPGFHPADRLLRVARQALERDEFGRENPEPSLGSRLGQIGVLGWMIIVPMLLGLLLGRWLDSIFMGAASGPHVFFSATFLMLGAAIGLSSAWRWMHGRRP
ncbi:MAG TPA: AtpZ/AtpI family protein [Pseudomonadota bacterium]|nr:AtpZ/AtpI family protein [Pseudomonadota bacterium]